MLPIDMTSTWIPLSLLALLCAYMVHLFRQERQEALAFKGSETAAGATAAAEAPTAEAAAPAEVPAAPPAPEKTMPVLTATPREEAAPKKRRGFIWRWWAMRIWVPLVAGLAGQGYLDFIRPLVEKAAH